MTTLVSRVACMRLLDCVTFSALPITRSATANLSPAPCPAPPACFEVRPTATAGDALIRLLHNPLRPRFQSAEVFRLPQQSNARHHPPPDDDTQLTSQRTRLMRGTLRAVGCMPLLGDASRRNHRISDKHHLMQASTTATTSSTNCAGAFSTNLALRAL